MKGAGRGQGHDGGFLPRINVCPQGLTFAAQLSLKQEGRAGQGENKKAVYLACVGVGRCTHAFDYAGIGRQSSLGNVT